jgi:hypothetical protein
MKLQEMMQPQTVVKLKAIIRTTKRPLEIQTSPKGLTKKNSYFDS